MNVKKCLSLLLTALLTAAVFTACGRWDYSREAAKAANEAQNAVVFEASSALAQSLKDALEDKVQVSDVEDAMEADERLDDLLGRLDVYAVEDDDAEAAAQTIAEGYIKGRVSGRQSDGHIAMVKADNGWFYAAVVTTTTGGSGSDDGNGGDTTPDPDPGTGGEDEGGDEPGTKNKYTVSWINPENGTITVTTSDGGNINSNSQVAEGTEITITVTADDGYKVTNIKAGDTELSSGGSCTVSSNVTITATIAEKTVSSIEVIERPENFTCYKTLDLSQIKIKVTYEDGTTRDLYASETGVTVEHYDQGYKMEGIFARTLRETLKLLFANYSDKIDSFFDNFAAQVKNRLEIEIETIMTIIGEVPVDINAYWDAKFTVKYKNQQDTFDVKLTCGAASSDIETILCEYCPNWDGKDNIAPSARGSQSAHFDTEG